MKVDVVLIYSPLVCAATLAPTHKLFLEQGHQSRLPDPSPLGSSPLPWRDWPARLLELASPTADTIFVGHSMGGRLAAKLAAETNAAGFICLDAAIPPPAGPMQPVEPDFLNFLKSLPRNDDGRLPPWHEWWPVDPFDGAPISEPLRTAIETSNPALALDWFDDIIEMPDCSSTRAGFVRTSRAFAEDARRAEAFGWPVLKLRGTHLHPALEPDETVDALVECYHRITA